MTGSVGNANIINFDAHIPEIRERDAQPGESVTVKLAPADLVPQSSP